MPRSPFIAYVDETGDHGLLKIDPASPIFVLCAAVYRIDDYLVHDMARLSELKFKFWWHDNIVFHSHAIRKRLPPFQALRVPARRARFVKEMTTFFEESKVTLIAAAIDKTRHVQSYKMPDNPYSLAVQFVLERIYGHVKTKGGAKDETFCIFESRGKREDGDVRRWFDITCGGSNQWNRKLPFRLEFAPKSRNMAGLQIADLAAYPIAKHVQYPEQERSDWGAVEPRIRRSPKDEIEGWGLKVFPPKS